MHRALVTMVLCAVSSVAAAQSYPARPIRLLVPFAAGGSTDLVARVVGQRLNTVGGVAPSAPCGKPNAGARQQVKYQADYVFYKK